MYVCVLITANTYRDTDLCIGTALTVAWKGSSQLRASTNRRPLKNAGTDFLEEQKATQMHVKIKYNSRARPLHGDPTLENNSHYRVHLGSLKHPKFTV